MYPEEYSDRVGLTASALMGALRDPFYLAAGLRNLSVMRSDSPMSRYFCGSSPAGTERSGGNVQTPFLWSCVSFGLRFTSELPTYSKPAALASAITRCSD